MSLYQLTLYTTIRKGCMKMEIQQLTEETVIHISPLFNAYRMFYEQESNMEAATDFIKERLQNKESIIFAAKIDNHYVGFTQLYPTFSSVAMKRAFILNDLFVIEGYRKNGVAKALMDTAFQFAIHQGARFITLETGANNTKAQALYEKMGMTIDNDVKHYVYYW